MTKNNDNTNETTTVKWDWKINAVNRILAYPSEREFFSKRKKKKSKNIELIPI